MLAIWVFKADFEVNVTLGLERSSVHAAMEKMLESDLLTALHVRWKMLGFPWLQALDHDRKTEWI